MGNNYSKFQEIKIDPSVFEWEITGLNQKQYCTCIAKRKSQNL